MYVCGNGWLNRFDQHPCEGADGSGSVTASGMQLWEMRPW